RARLQLTDKFGGLGPTSSPPGPPSSVPPANATFMGRSQPLRPVFYASSAGARIRALGYPPRGALWTGGRPCGPPAADRTFRSPFALRKNGEGRSGQAALHEIRAAFADHDARRICVAADETRHDRG